jgi:hypothetical protein
MNEKVVLVGVKPYGIFRSVCDVEDTADPEVKIFRFREGVNWGSFNCPKPRAITRLHVYHHWEEFDVGECEGKYRVAAVLETQPGYIAVFQGTTKPEEIREVSSPNHANEDDCRCELAIMEALDKEPRLTLRTLKRKVNANRFPAFDECLKRLANEGELSVEPDTAMPQRTWVTAVAVANSAA